MKRTLQPNSLVRIFGISVILTTLISGVSIYYGGISILPIMIALLIIEITFSFENAIINAKVLTTMSRLWQTMFLTIGIFIAIFGMRIVFPIALVSIATGTSWQTVLDMALNDPASYTTQLESAYPTIASFGGAFLMMLALTFFFDKQRKVLWLRPVELLTRRLANPILPLLITSFVVMLFAALPSNTHPNSTITAGTVGIATFLVVHGLAEFFTKIQYKRRRTSPKSTIRHGMAAFITFMYLEVLDASFSLDSVIGAFAITNQVLLIAAGLGIGAVWVRSMTVFMVQKGSLGTYRYLEHGAHYTVILLAVTMFIHIPEIFAGIAGIAIISCSVIASKRAQLIAAKGKAVHH